MPVGVVAGALPPAVGLLTAPTSTCPPPPPVPPIWAGVAAAGVALRAGVDAVARVVDPGAVGAALPVAVAVVFGVRAWGGEAGTPREPRTAAVAATARARPSGARRSTHRRGRGVARADGGSAGTGTGAGDAVADGSGTGGAQSAAESVGAGGGRSRVMISSGVGRAAGSLSRQAVTRSRRLLSTPLSAPRSGLSCTIR